uniref:Uncharacterized protein n=1 Tax=viral metagenome TaxID=1070528 RepID=A0A6C0AZY2_9ZZZZ
MDDVVKIPKNFCAILGSFKSIQEFHGVKDNDINHLLSNFPQYGDINNFKKINDILYDYYWSPNGDGYLEGIKSFEETRSKYGAARSIKRKRKKNKKSMKKKKLKRIKRVKSKKKS